MKSLTITKALFGLDTTTSVIVGAAILLAVAIAFGLFVPWLRDFRRELKFINMEINRTTGREQQHWIKRKKRLKLSILPFFHY